MVPLDPAAANALGLACEGKGFSASAVHHFKSARALALATSAPHAGNTQDHSWVADDVVTHHTPDNATMVALISKNLARVLWKAGLQSDSAAEYSALGSKGLLAAQPVSPCYKCK